MNLDKFGHPRNQFECAVDKFVGYCANKNHADDKRLKLNLNLV